MEENTAYSDLVLNVRYIYHDMWKGRNEIVDRMPLMTGGPWSILLITAGYIWFATVSGPNYMKNRDAFDLRPILLVYNVIMMLINGYIFYKAAFFTNFGIYPWRCEFVCFVSIIVMIIMIVNYNHHQCFLHTQAAHGAKSLTK